MHTSKLSGLFARLFEDSFSFGRAHVDVDVRELHSLLVQNASPIISNGADYILSFNSMKIESLVFSILSTSFVNSNTQSLEIRFAIVIF